MALLQILAGTILITLQAFITLLTTTIALVVFPFWAVDQLQPRGPYVAIVSRPANSEFESQLLLSAESYCPERDDAGVQCPEGPVAAGHCDRVCGEVDGFPLPYAVTGDTWRYYQDLVSTLQQSAETGEYAWPENLRFSYYTVISERSVEEDGEDGYRVELLMYFSYTCDDNQFCKLRFSKSRYVYFDVNGNITRVTGDGPTNYSRN